jgi:hypothetical protein
LAHAVHGYVASVIGPAHPDASPVRYVSVISVWCPVSRYGRAIASDEVYRHNCVFSRTAGDFVVLNQSLLAAAG